MKKEKVRFGLKQKFLVYIISGIITMGGLFCTHYIYQSHKILVRDLEDKGVYLTRNLAYNSKYGVMTKNRTILNQLLDGIYHNSDINSCAIYDDQGRIIANRHKTRENIILFTPEELMKLDFPQGLHISYNNNRKHPLLNVVIPIIASELSTNNTVNSDDTLLKMEESDQFKLNQNKKSKPHIIGYVQTSISLQTLLSEKKSILYAGFLITLLIIGVGVVFSFAFAREMIKPIKLMTDTTKRIAQGDLSLRVTKYANDEIGVLGDFFNHMVNSLEKRNDEIQQLNQNLEQKVSMRTSELEITNQQLRKERDNAQNYLDTAGVMLIIINKDKTVSLINKKGCEILGYQEDEILGKSWFENFLPERIRAKSEQFFSNLVTEKVLPLEYYENPVLARNGNEKFILWHNTVLKNEQGQVIAILSSGEDITERKQAEETLKRKEEIQSTLNTMLTISLKPYDLSEILTQILGEIVSIPWLTLQTQGVIFLAESPGELTLKVSKGFPEHLRLKCAKVPFGKCLCGRAAATRQIHFSNTINPRHENRYKGISPHGHYCLPIISSSNEILGVLNLYVKENHIRNEEEEELLLTIVNVLAGIIERKRAEEELVKAHNELEIRVEERTAELERSNRELEQFAYVASHDLQEPLRKVRSYTELLAQRYSGHIDDKADKFINYVVDGTTRMQRLITDLLIYSRVGRAELALEPTNVFEILEEVLMYMEATIKEHNAVITYDNLPTVMFKSSQMVQLLQNLIGNALKFHSKEPPNIHISAERTENYWLFSVRDNGIGIELEYAERIFIIFQRLHTRAEYPGTGIGLAICKKIVEDHGGRIWIDSTPKKGSTFYFTIKV